MDRTQYFDNAATTPLDPRVREAMLPYLEEGFGNASSIHAWGQRSRDAVERARHQVVGLLGAEDPTQIIFTSGATESNNWILRAFSSGAISPFEHNAVREPGLHLGYREMMNEGLTLRPPDEQVELISVMSVNNELGARWRAQDFAEGADYIHSDITQGFGKLPTDLDGLDYASFSAHKLYGPKGVGGLYYQANPPVPYLLGGEQEYQLRAGTLNVTGIVGFGTACAIAAEEWESDLAHAVRLRQAFIESLRAPDFQEGTDWQINGGEGASPYIVSLSVLGIEGESLVIEADHRGFAISSGAACSAGSTDPSHVLIALGLTQEWLRGTVRISFGRFNNLEATINLAKCLVLSAQKLRTMT